MIHSLLIRRLLTVLVLTGCLSGLSLAAPPTLAPQENGASTGGDGTPKDTFPHWFGEPGEPGSYRVLFDARGAGIWRVWLGDHYATPEITERARAGKPIAEPEGYLTVASNVEQGSLSMMLRGRRLNGEPVGYTFPRGLDERWSYEIADGEVRFRLPTEEGITFEKVYRHDPEHRLMVMELALIADASFAGAEQKQLLGTFDGLMLKPEVRKVDSNLLGNVDAAFGQVRAGGELGELMSPTWSEIPEAPLLASQEAGAIVFAGSASRYFCAVYLPAAEDDTPITRATATTVPRRPNPDLPEVEVGKVPRAIFDFAMTVPAAGDTTRVEVPFYLGPKSASIIRSDAALEPLYAVLDHDLEPICFCNPPFVQSIAQLLIWILRSFESLVGSWGVAIILLTVLVRGLMTPLNFRMQKSMRAYASKMAVLKPKLDELQKRYADDKAELQRQMIAFQREHKMIPPLGGCLPIFLSMPVYIGLFTALRVVYELRHEPFLFVNDLGQPDAIFEIGWSFQPVFNILPLIWIGLFAFLTFRQPLPKDPQQRQVQSIMRFMPLIFGVLLYNYASALLVYMITSVLWGMIESRLFKKILGPVDPNAAGAAPMPVM